MSHQLIPSYPILILSDLIKSEQSSRLKIFVEFAIDGGISFELLHLK